MVLNYVYLICLWGIYWGDLRRFYWWFFWFQVRNWRRLVHFLPRYLKLFQAVLSCAETSLTYSKMFGILSDRLGWDELSWFGLYFVNFVNFACQTFFPIVRLIALSFLQEIILIWEIFADIWYFSFYLFLIFLLISLYWALCLLLCFWCTQSMSFGCLPKQRAKSVYRSYFGFYRINLQFSF